MKNILEALEGKHISVEEAEVLVLNELNVVHELYDASA